MIINNNKIWIYNLQLKLYTVVTVWTIYRDTILALKASGVSISTMSGASRFQSRTLLGKNDIFLVSIRGDGIWNDPASVYLSGWEYIQKLRTIY